MYYFQLGHNPTGTKLRETILGPKLVGDKGIWMKRASLAVAASIAFHVMMILIENALGPDRKTGKALDSAFSWPAWFFSQLVPPGHGIVQLVFPFIFSLLFYAGVFWLLFSGLAYVNRKERNAA